MLGLVKKGIWKIVRAIPFTRFFYETRDTQTPIRFGMWFMQKVVGYNRDAYWPMHFTSIVGNPKNIYAGIDTSPGYSPGCYIQGGGKVYVGDYTQIAPNVGIISSNHDLYDSRKKIVKEVRIGKYCWIGMNAVILPGVVVGDFTIIAAGAVVTKSFEEGYCVIGGNPARKIKDLVKKNAFLLQMNMSITDIFLLRILKHSEQKN
ncbi:acyltransferase [Chryseobacterium arthrosphaerae]|uniref:Acyltransferase n=1 Tax=Chryseobacterium arthrosphaerae TaxID=651561 RepID=A0A432DZP1_9FLAO|nr:acyltransferase [Chryseobacterium arthrosphaerae]